MISALTSLLNFIPGPLRWMLLAGAVAAGGAIVFAYNGALEKAERLEHQVAKLERDIASRKEVENVLRQNNKLKDETIAALDKHSAAFGTTLKKVCERWEKIKNSDKPVDDLLEELAKENRNAD